MRKENTEAHEASEDTESDIREEAEPIVKKRKIVIPGEIIVSGEDFLPSEGARREGNDIVSNRFGLSEEAGRVVKVIPITGAFIPRRNNVVIGRVTNITMNGWVIDVDSAQSAFLPIDESPRFINKHEMDQFLAIGDILVAKIWSINQRGIDLSLKSRGLGKIEGGFVFRVSPNRVPRIIGREGSMISLIKEKTQTDLTVGQNGWIWISTENIEGAIKARKACEFIAENIHLEGLTEKVEEMLV
ncbi:MAG: exosome complex RNA-binding protein Rrp4 [Nanoarchaeota archaeon]